eukprot:2297733-Pyramimonas_sp.AAC.1
MGMVAVGMVVRAAVASSARGLVAAFGRNFPPSTFRCAQSRGGGARALEAPSSFEVSSRDSAQHSRQGRPSDLQPPPPCPRLPFGSVLLGG